MGLRLRRARKPKGKKVSYRLIDRETNQGALMYSILSDLVEQHHEELVDARIALAWCTSWRPDVDGKVVLGKCKKASDLDRELVAFDFIILLSQSFWDSKSVTDAQRRALLDHELCHATVKLDDRTGEPVYDERGRKVYRLRKHDLEEFRCIAERYGVWKQDLEQFAQALRRHMPEKKREAIEEAQKLIASCEDCGGTTWRGVIVDGEPKAVRCDCHVKAREITAQAEATL